MKPYNQTVNRETPPTLHQRVLDYLANGGLFNPEMMNHPRVRELVIDLAKECGLITANEALTDVENYTQEMRERGDGDLRSILYHIKSIKKTISDCRERKNKRCSSQSVNFVAKVGPKLTGTAVKFRCD